MEDLRKYTQKSELYKLSAEEQTEKMQLVMQEVQKISTYTGVSEEAAYDLFSMDMMCHLNWTGKR